jgi:hypothetical protein
MAIESTETHISLPNPRAAFRPDAAAKAERPTEARSMLLARAFELGIHGFDTMTDEDLERAIRKREETLGRSLQ